MSTQPSRLTSSSCAVAATEAMDLDSSATFSWMDLSLSGSSASSSSGVV
ncbi:MAG: hypothetical protein QXZ03_01810 [Nitrososphaerota archaeon]